MPRSISAKRSSPLLALPAQSTGSWSSASMFLGQILLGPLRALPPAAQCVGETIHQGDANQPPPTRATPAANCIKQLVFSRHASPPPPANWPAPPPVCSFSAGYMSTFALVADLKNSSRLSRPPLSPNASGVAARWPHLSPAVSECSMVSRLMPCKMRSPNSIWPGQPQRLNPRRPSGKLKKHAMKLPGQYRAAPHPPGFASGRFCHRSRPIGERHAPERPQSPASSPEIPARLVASL